MSSLPKKIRVLGMDVTVTEITQPSLPQGVVPDFGCTDIRALNINIDATAHEIQKRQTLLHEILHMVDGLLHVEKDWLSEKQTAAISQGLYAVFVDNPGLSMSLFEQKENADEK